MGDTRLTPEQRSLRAKVAAHTSWAHTENRAARTAARRAALGRFERQVDPDGVLPPEGCARRAGVPARRIFLGLAVKSAAARARRAG